MKKIFFAVVMVAVALSASAQPQEKADFKTGKNSVEIGFNPFNTDWENFRIDELKYRRFFGNHALRVGFGIQFESSKGLDENGDVVPGAYYETYDKSTGDGTMVGTVENYSKTKTTEFKLAAGYEYHFNVAPRVSLYAGGELGYIGKFYNSNEIFTADYEIYSGDDLVGRYSAATDLSISSPSKNRSNAFFMSALAGMDFHVYRGLYLGCEVKLGYKYEKFSDTYKDGTEVEYQYDAKGNLVGGHEYTYTTSGARQTVSGYTINSDGSKTSVPETSTEKEVVSSYQEFKLRAEGALRIGYRF